MPSPVSGKVTGNTGRLALRQSRAQVANALVAMVNHPLVATSANISGHPTCRSGIEAFGVMDGRVDLVVDGGACVGPGATTVDITEPYWKVIKEGAVPEKEMEGAVVVVVSAEFSIVRKRGKDGGAGG